jgi:hypothetical protein
MESFITTENYRYHDKGYWRFSVYCETGDISFVSHGWRYQNEKLHGPFVTIESKCYSSLLVSKPIAKAIYLEVLRKVGELESRTIPFNDKAWKASTMGRTSIERWFPEFYREKFGGDAEPQSSVKSFEPKIKKLTTPPKGGHLDLSAFPFLK